MIVVMYVCPFLKNAENFGIGILSEKPVPTCFVIPEFFRLRVGSLGALKRTKNWQNI